ncbi:hypothetical protein ACQ1PV_10700 [Ornithobacterium rhinotracheale]
MKQKGLFIEREIEKKTKKRDIFLEDKKKMLSLQSVSISGWFGSEKKLQKSFGSK